MTPFHPRLYVRFEPNVAPPPQFEVVDPLVTDGGQREGVALGYLPPTRGRATIGQVEALPEVAYAWLERPNVSPTLASRATREDARPPTAGGDGVGIAIIERAWGEGAGQGRGGVHAEVVGNAEGRSWEDHGDHTCGTVRRFAVDAALGLFSTLHDARGPGEELLGTLQRARAWMDRFERAILLVEIQKFLLEDQLPDLVRPDPHGDLSPGGRVAAGPVDADPGVAELLGRVHRRGHLVVVPAGNGRRDISAAKPAHLVGTLSDDHAALRVGAGFEGARIAGSNFGAGAVDLCADGWEVPAELAGSRRVRWSGTSAAAAVVAGAAAELWTVDRSRDDVVAELRRRFPPR